MSYLQGCQAGAQGGAIHLASIRDGERCHDVAPGRAASNRQPDRQQSGNLLAAQVADRDEGKIGLRIRGDSGGSGDTRDVQRGCLDLLTGDPDAVPLEGIVQSATQEEVALLVQITEIAGPQPSVTGWRGAEALARQP